MTGSPPVTSTDPRLPENPARPPAIEIVGLVKTFAQHRALDALDLQVPAGSVFGFLGRNGAGKTTTLRILLGLARPDAGRALILGHDVTRANSQLRARVGYLPDVPGCYPWITGREFLGLCANLFAIPSATARRRIDALFDLAGLADVTQRVGGYSRGMRQRLGIAQALINAPEVLLLDEPTSALDPLGRMDVLDMIQQLSGKTTVLFSTHILGDVERVCDRVAIVEAGRVVAQGSVRELTGAGTGQRLLVDVGTGADTLRSELERASWVRSLAPGQPGHAPGLLVDVGDVDLAQHELPRLVSRLGLGLIRMEPLERSLEDVFVSAVGTARGTTDGQFEAHPGPMPESGRGLPAGTNPTHSPSDQRRAP